MIVGNIEVVNALENIGIYKGKTPRHRIHDICPVQYRTTRHIPRDNVARAQKWKGSPTRQHSYVIRRC